MRSPIISGCVWLFNWETSVLGPVFESVAPPSGFTERPALGLQAGPDRRTRRSHVRSAPGQSLLFHVTQFGRCVFSLPLPCSVFLRVFGGTDRRVSLSRPTLLSLFFFSQIRRTGARRFSRRDEQVSSALLGSFLWFFLPDRLIRGQRNY